jgi:hypothetical protein
VARTDVSKNLSPYSEANFSPSARGTCRALSASHLWLQQGALASEW